jgi:exopolysaccharide production protein ExoZ
MCLHAFRNALESSVNIAILQIVFMMNVLQWVTQRFELSRHGDAGNVRPMEGLRGMAVFLVFLTHYVSLMSPRIEQGSLLDVISDSIHTMGTSGVDLFFVLSGYLIYASMISRRQDFLPFMRRRIVRIYPAFIVVFVLYLVLSFFYPAGSKIPDGAYAATSYVLQNFLLLPGMFPITPLITVAWSLSYEMFYYLAIPLIITVFRLRERSPVFRMVFFLAVAAILAAYSVVYAGHVRLVMFIAGIMLYEAMRNSNSTITPPVAWVGLLALAAGLLANLLPLSGSLGVVAIVLIQACSFFVVCFACFVLPLDSLARAFSWTPLRWLGNMSYSYYLLHGLALKASYMLLFPNPTAIQHDFGFFFEMLPIMFAVTLLPSAILFLAVERPFSLKAELRGKSTAGAATVASAI